MVSIGIYKITNPTHRIYIGQSINIEQRWKGYSITRLKSQPKIKNSIIKYGFENHNFEIIEECSLEQLNERETYWKLHFLNEVQGDWSKVLFCELHDTGGGPRNEITKQKISNTKTGVKSTQKTKDNISLGKTGVKFSDTHKQNITNSKKGCKYPTFSTRKDKGVSRNYHIEAVIEAKSKPIYQFDKSNNFIKEFKNGVEASKLLNLPQSNINSCCNNKVKTCGGFIFKFK